MMKRSIVKRTTIGRSRYWLAVSLAAVLATTGLVACSSDSDKGSAAKDSAATTESTVVTDSTEDEAPAQKLKILVSNDDGYNAPGIDALVRALVEMPDVEVVVSAPATQQSGKGAKVTEGELTATEGKTLSGYPVHIVAGTPADSVNWALDGGIDFEPDLVVTGINAGQNLGGITNEISGTVGAARTAVGRGFPALATSLGAASIERINEPDDVPAFDDAARYVVEWVTEHRDDILSGKDAGDGAGGKASGDTPLFENLNVPLCATGGERRGVARVELSPEFQGAIDPQNCQSTTPQPSDDINAFLNGFVTITAVPAVTPAG